jgi:hypothetical protein
MAKQSELAGDWLVDTGKNLGECRLASSIFTNDGMYFAFVEIELNVI